MADRRQERRALFEAILGDAAASHSERLRADEALCELELEERRVAAVDRLTPDQALAEAESLAAAMPGIVVCARVAAGADAMDVVDPPVEEAPARCRDRASGARHRQA